MSEQINGVIGLVHGSGHGAWSWDLLLPELKARGYRGIAMDLPMQDPDATYDDYAAVAADALMDGLGDEERIDLLVPWSGGAHTAPGIARRLGDLIGGIVYLSPSVGEDKTSADTAQHIPAQTRRRNSEDFVGALMHLDNGLTIFDPARMRDLFYNSCEDPEDVLWAIERVKPHRRPSYEPPMSEHAAIDVPKWLVRGNADQIRIRDWFLRTARTVGGTAIEIDGDHSLAISRPGQLADLLADIAASNAPEETTRPIPSLDHIVLPHQHAYFSPWAAG